MLVLHRKNGFTFIEVLIGSVVLSLIAGAIYAGFVGVMRVRNLTAERLLAVDIANEQMERIKNLPYQEVGVKNSALSGALDYEIEVTRDNRVYLMQTTARYYDDPYDGTAGGSPDDNAPEDGKFIEVTVFCDTCRDYNPVFLSTRISPPGLEVAVGNGSLFVQVFDASGEPVVDADVCIENETITFSDTVPDCNGDDVNHLVINDTTNNYGLVQQVSVPPAQLSYEIVVTKDGYSSARTYAPSEVTPATPVTAHTSVVEGDVTQVSFAIDVTSDLTFQTTTASCDAVSGVSFGLLGTKNIATAPSIRKHEFAVTTNGGGSVDISDVEWDNYSLSLLDGVYQIIGSNPAVLLTVNPGINQTVDLVVGPYNPSTVVVTAKDGATGGPVSGVTVTLKNDSGSVTLAEKITGRGSFNQTDWSGGGGNNGVTNGDEYVSATQVVTNEEGQISLAESFPGTYYSGGELLSAIIDVGAPANFETLTLEPVSQPGATGVTPVRMQLASSTVLDPSVTPEPEDDYVWLGPDGTSGTYYTAPGEAISGAHNGDRYFKYRILLSTDDTAVTPVVQDIGFEYTSDCVPSGQVYFDGLADNESYLVELDNGAGLTGSTGVTFAGGEDWQQVQVVLTDNS